MILVDTSVWVDFFNKRDSKHSQKLFDLINSREYPLYVCGIIVNEILQGIKEDENFRHISNLLSGIEFIEPQSIITYVSSAAIYRKCRTKGITIRNTIDCLIAAIAIEHRLRLFHNDKDFEHIGRHVKLDIYTW